MQRHDDDAIAGEPDERTKAQPAAGGDEDAFDDDLDVEIEDETKSDDEEDEDEDEDEEDEDEEDDDEEGDDDGLDYFLGEEDDDA